MLDLLDGFDQILKSLFRILDGYKALVTIIKCDDKFSECFADFSDFRDHYILSSEILVIIFKDA